MKNAIRFFFSPLAAFVVAIACGGNQPTGPGDGQDSNQNQDPTNPDPTNPDPNMGCEPDCPVMEVKTITRGLTFPTAGDFINVNGNMVVDANGHAILTTGETMVMVEMPSEGTPQIDVVRRIVDETGERPGGLRATSSARNFMPEMAGNPVSLWYWAYGPYDDETGDYWVDFDHPTAIDEWSDVEIEPNPSCPAEGGWGSATSRRISSLGQVGVPELCNHDNRTVSLCACRDPRGGSEPVLCTGCPHDVWAWGSLSFPPNMGEELDLMYIGILTGNRYQVKFVRVVPTH